MSLRFVTDEDFNGFILRSLRRKRPDLDIVRVQDVGLAEAQDVEILAWAAREGRIVLSHDASTMKDHALARVAVGLLMPGVVIVDQSCPIGRAVNEILYLADESQTGEWEDEVLFLPF